MFILPGRAVTSRLPALRARHATLLANLGRVRSWVARSRVAKDHEVTLLATRRAQLLRILSAADLALVVTDLPRCGAAFLHAVLTR